MPNVAHNRKIAKSADAGVPDPPPGIEKNRPVHVHGHPSCVWTSWVEVAEAAAGWDVELPKGVFQATEWIAAGFSACVDGGSAPLGGDLGKGLSNSEPDVIRYYGDTSPDSPVLAGESFLHLEW